MSHLKSTISFSLLMALICSVSSSALAMPTIRVVGPVILDAPLAAHGVNTPADEAPEHLELHGVLDNVWAGDRGSENRIADASGKPRMAPAGLDARLLLWHDAKRLDAVTKIA